MFTMQSNTNCERVREEILRELVCSNGDRYASLAEYAAAVNLLARVDAELLDTPATIEDATVAAVTSPSLAVRSGASALQALRAEALAEAVVRDACFDRELALGFYSTLTRPASDSP